MSWLVVSYHPGFAVDPTSWTTTIERKGKLIQRVNDFFSTRTIEHRIKLSWEQIMEIEMLVDAIDFDALRTAGQPKSVMEDQGFIRVQAKTAGVVNRFELPLLAWEWDLARGELDRIPDWDFAPLLALWRAVDLVSPHRLGDSRGRIEADPVTVGGSDEPREPSISSGEPKR